MTTNPRKRRKVMQFRKGLRRVSVCLRCWRLDGKRAGSRNPRKVFVFTPDDPWLADLEFRDEWKAFGCHLPEVSSWDFTGLPNEETEFYALCDTERTRVVAWLRRQEAGVWEKARSAGLDFELLFEVSFRDEYSGFDPGVEVLAACRTLLLPVRVAAQIEWSAAAHRPRDAR
jgi:hypothetical protein